MAGDRPEAFGVHEVVGLRAGADGLGLVFEPDLPEETERLLETGAILFTDAAGGGRIAEALLRSDLRAPDRERVRPRDARDQRDAAVLRVERSDVLALRLDDEVVQEARRRTCRCGVPGQVFQEDRERRGS